MELNEKKTRYLMRLSLWLKSFLALTEIIGGLMLFFLSQNTIIQFVYKITQEELSEDPNDFISRQLVLFSHNLFPSLKHFLIVYLLFHGIVKMLVIVGLLKNKLWAYPAAIVVFTFLLFINSIVFILLIQYF